MKCVHCLTEMEKATRDHVFPKSWYPDSTPSNVQRPTVPSCGSCNNNLGALEREFFYKLGLCLDCNKAEASGIDAKVFRSLGIGIQKELSAKEMSIRKKTLDRLSSEIISYLPGSDEDMYPGMGLHPGIPMEKQMVSIISPQLIDKCVEKILRGLEYINGGNRYIEYPYVIEIYAIPEEALRIQNFHNHFADFGVKSDYGPGLKIERVSVDVNGYNMTIYKIVIWGQMIVYGTIALEDLEMYRIGK